MSRISAPKGTEDILPQQSWKWQAIENIARRVAQLYHFSEIRTPIFEHTELFHRGVGEASDVVSKETFTFNDRASRSLTLRPEGTAGVVRAAIENNLLAQEGSRSKVFYVGPNFRYEKPQRGRLHIHHQFGVEAFGSAEPEQDAECILLQHDFYRRCGVREMELKINSLGDGESKERYRQRIVEHLSPMRDRLSPESRQRLETNPLRILDSKDAGDQRLLAGLPAASDCLSDKSRKHFERVAHLLQASQIPFRIDNHLVRGFDYYTETLWEVTASGLGSQNAMGGGGRYDNLVETLGGRPTPGVGFGSGLERLLIALEEQNVSLPDPRQPLVFLVAHGEAARDACWKLLAELRSVNIAADMDLSGRSIKAQFKIADREAARFTLVIGDNELAAKQVVLKNFQTGEQASIDRARVIDRIRADIDLA